MRIFCLTIVCIGVIGNSISTAIAQEDRAAALKASRERIQTLRKERPNDGLLIFYEALVGIGLGERNAAFDLLRSLKGRKLGLVPVRDAGFDAVWDDPDFQKIRKDFVDEEAKTADSPVAFRLKDPKLVPEGIAYDPAGKRFFIGSIAQHKIIVSDPKGQARDFSSASDKLDTVLGLAIDSTRAGLYAVSTNGFEDSGKSERRNAVVRYDLKTGRLTDRFNVADAMQLNDVAITGDGTVYATDSASGSLFRKKPDENAFSKFGETGALRGANGIAVSDDASLYVTLSTGIARVDTTSGAPTRLPQPDSVVTGGIDGLYWHQGDLVGVQNGPNPGRVIRIRLTDKGNRIDGLTVLQSSHHPDFTEPTTGAIADDVINIIGNSYVGHYEPSGNIRDADKLKGTAIVAVPLKR